MSDKILDGLNVVDRAGNQPAGALRMKKAVGQTLQVGIHPDHKAVQDIKRHLVGETPIAIPKQPPADIHHQQQSGNAE